MAADLIATLKKWNLEEAAKAAPSKPPKEKSITLAEARAGGKINYLTQLHATLIEKEAPIKEAVKALWLTQYFAKKGDWDWAEQLQHGSGSHKRLFTALRCIRDSTLRTNAYWAFRMLNWADANGIGSVGLIQEEHVQNWLLDAAMRGINYSTIKNMRAGVSFLFRHSARAIADSPWTSDTMKQIRQIAAKPPTQRPPITADFVKKAVRIWLKGEVPRTNPYAVALLCMAMAFLMNCRGEHMHRALWSKLRIAKFDDLAIIQLQHAITKSTEGDAVYMSACVDATHKLGFSLIALLQTVAKAQRRTSPWIFAYEDKGKITRMTAAKQSYYYKQFAKAMGLANWQQFGAHSPRIGASTAASMLGISEEERRIFGKWKIGSEMMTRYAVSRHTLGAKLSYQILAGTSDLSDRNYLCRVKKARKQIIGWEGARVPWRLHHSKRGLTSDSKRPTFRSRAHTSARLRFCTSCGF